MSEQSKNMKILIVDDDYDFRSTLLEYFIDKGHSAFGAENGQCALNLINKKHYDIVLLDLDMPIMSGLETMEEIHKRSSNTYIIIVSGKVNPEKYFYYKNGCILFEKKPIDIIELEYKVSNILNGLKKQNKKTIPEDSIIELDINSIYDFIIDNIGNHNLNADLIVEYFGINKKQLYSRVGQILTISLHETIKNIRLLKAYEMVNKGTVRTIKELSSHVGYSDAGYFTKLFRKGFDIELNNELAKAQKKLDLKF